MKKLYNHQNFFVKLVFSPHLHLAMSNGKILSGMRSINKHAKMSEWSDLKSTNFMMEASNTMACASISKLDRTICKTHLKMYGVIAAYGIISKSHTDRI